MAVAIRRARPDDVDFLHALGLHGDIDPFLAALRDRSREHVAAEVERSQADPDAFGRFVIECDGVPAGGFGFERSSERSRIAELRNLAVLPEFRGRGVAVAAARLVQQHLIRELGFHRLQFEVYGFNERAQRHAERVGYVREGVRRNAYRHGDGWTDGVVYGLVAEDLEGGAGASG